MFSTSPGGSSAVGPASGGKTYAYNNITTSPAVVALTNTSRKRISFYNPGPVNIWVAPSIVQSLNTPPVTPSNVTLTPSLGALGGTYIVYANGGSMTIEGECQGAYQAFAAAGTTNALTVSESNV